MSGNLFFQGMMYLVTLVFGGWLIAHGKMEAADLAMYALYIGIFISPIQILVELTEMMQKGLSGFRRFLDVVETEPEIVNAPDAESIDEVNGDVSYENVSFIIVMMIRRFFLMLLSIFRQENRSRWSDLPEVVRRRSVRCCPDFMMSREERSRLTEKMSES